MFHGIQEGVSVPCFVDTDAGVGEVACPERCLRLILSRKLWTILRDRRASDTLSNHSLLDSLVCSQVWEVTFYRRQGKREKNSSVINRTLVINTTSEVFRNNEDILFKKCLTVVADIRNSIWVCLGEMGTAHT